VARIGSAIDPDSKAEDNSDVKSKATVPNPKRQSKKGIALQDQPAEL
jgi:hypothetical protein